MVNVTELKAFGELRDLVKSAKNITSDAEVDAAIEQYAAESEGELSGCTSVESAYLLLSAKIQAGGITGDTGSADPGAGNTISPAHTAKATKKKSYDSPISEDDKFAADEVIKAAEAAAVANRETVKLTGIYTRKPSVAERLGDITEMKITTTEAARKTLTSYVAINKAEQEKLNAMTAAFDAAVKDPNYKVKINVNKKARPVIEGYCFLDTSSKQPTAVPKNRQALRAYVTVMFNGRLIESTYEGKNTLGAFLRTLEDKDNPGQSVTSAVITGSKEYWEDAPTGIPTYDVVANETEDITVRSELSAIVSDSKGNRTVRLYGKAAVPKIKRKTEYLDKFGEISAGIQGGMKAKDQDAGKTQESAANVIAMLGNMKNLDDSLKSLPNIANVIKMFQDNKKKADNRNDKEDM